MERKILKTPNEVKAWFEDCPDTIAFDWETTGLNYLKMEPVGVSFCDGERSVYVDLWENKNYDKVCRVLAKELVCRSLIAHNLKFDFKCLSRFGILDNNSLWQSSMVSGATDGRIRFFCSYIASFLLDENRPSHSLDSLAEEYLGIGKAGKWEDYTDWHSQEFYEYAMVDAEHCYRLYELFLPRIKEEKLEHVFQIEMDFIPVAAEMEMNGILIDQGELSALQSHVEQKILDCEDKMLMMVGKRPNIQTGLFGQQFRVTPVNFNSSQQLVECFKKLGLPLTEKTSNGAWSISKTTLNKLKGEPFVDSLTEYKMLQKLYSSYILPCWELIDEDGRIRPTVGIVKTGRTSMSSPNLQQLPNVRDKTINYRRIFSSNGNLIGADYSGQELRILGEITQDETIIEAFRMDKDLHLLTASKIFDLPLVADDLVNGSPGHKRACVDYKSERYKAKNGANFPIVYGSSAGGIAWRQGVSKDEAQRWVDGFFKAYPRVKSCMSEIPNRLYKDGYVCTLMGRRRRFSLYKNLPQWSRGKQPSKDRCVRQAFNFMIQGFAADQAKIAGRKIYDQLKAHHEWKARILMLVHDEYVIECLEEKYVDTVKNCIINCMENAVALSVPFKVDCKVGKSYDQIK